MEVIKALTNPVDLIRQFSDEPPNIVVLSPQTKRSPVKSTTPVKKYVTLSSKVITPPLGVGRSDLVDTNTTSPLDSPDPEKDNISSIVQILLNRLSVLIAINLVPDGIMLLIG